MRVKTLFAFLVFLLLCISVVPGQSLNAASTTGAVYTMTNSPEGNEIVVFNRCADGLLTKAGSVATGGLGSGGDLDALGSQGSLALSPDGKWLLAVNAGSSEISIFGIGAQGLRLVDKVPSCGTRPVSLTVQRSMVYVLNAGDTPNITGFWINADGRLVRLLYSTRRLNPADYGQVGFSRGGYSLVVTDKGNNQILSFSMAWFGYPLFKPVVSPSNGLTPFGFIFDQRNHLLVAEAGSKAVSSYQKLLTGTYGVISGSVFNGQTATCWIAGGMNYSFTSNPGSDSLSSYKSTYPSGMISLVDATAGAGNKPLDLAMTPDGSYLYVLNAGNGTVGMFRINANGSLTDLGTVDGTLPIYAQGMAAR
jgi:6-phosphogluconolactonase